jgi:hypothetical protein
MPGKPRSLTGEMEHLIESALMPGRFISYNANFDFIRGLEAVEKHVAGWISTDPKLAASLLETFIAGCHEKAEEIDDSTGSLGEFVGQLFRDWINVRQAAGASPDETAARLLAWMDDDPYGFCYQLGSVAPKVLNRAGLTALEKLVRARFDAPATVAPDRSREDQRGRSGEILRSLYLARRDVEAFVALSETTGLVAKDCLDLATMLVARRKKADALSWVERGLALDEKGPHRSTAGYDLARLKRDLLTKLGRGDEALDAAWTEFGAHPSKYSYEELMKYVPKADRRSWHEKAIEGASGADLHSLIELLLATKETERLAVLVARSKNSILEGVSHYATEPAARSLEKAHPELAARLWCAQGMRIVNAKKSKYYAAALSNFERARRCYEKAGLLADWQRVVSKVRAEHQRKTGFMTGFEEVVAGSGPSEKPSFLERAKARWGSRR